MGWTTNNRFPKEKSVYSLRPPGRFCGPHTLSSNLHRVLFPGIIWGNVLEIFWRVWGKPQDTAFELYSPWAEIWNSDLPNTKNGCYISSKRVRWRHFLKLLTRELKVIWMWSRTFRFRCTLLVTVLKLYCIIYTFSFLGLHSVACFYKGNCKWGWGKW
jgi:hypothetical protein